jgi:glycosyltransferase involved in cell wall biosynthesis
MMDDKMRILHVIPSLNKGGAERLVLDICEHLSRLPHVEVRLIILHDEIKYDVSQCSFEIKHIPAAVKLSVTRAHEYHLDELRAYILVYQPDVIHAHLFEADLVTRCIDYPRARWFSHCHDAMFQYRNLSFKTLVNKELALRWYEKQFLLQRCMANGGNCYVAISANIKAYFKSVLPSGRPSLRLKQLHNATDTARFERTAPHVFAPSKSIRLVTVGSLLPNKNQRFLIEVTSQLRHQGIKAELAILGDGPNRKVLQDQIQQAGLDKHVTLYGNVDKVEAYLWQSDIYVHAAHSEAFGLVLVEAMAASLPVVTLDGGGNRDLIIDGQNGYFISQREVAPFVDAIVRLAQDKALYSRLSSAAHVFAQRFDIKQYVLALMDMYGV